MTSYTGTTSEQLAEARKRAERFRHIIETKDGFTKASARANLKRVLKMIRRLEGEI
jgi:hypothetical protein